MIDELIIGFTGTQKGITENQQKAFDWLMPYSVPRWKEFHHGDCIGADKEANDLVESRWEKFHTKRRGPHYEVQLWSDYIEDESRTPYKIVIHPPRNRTKRAFCQPKGGLILPPKDYIPRNHDIVDVSNVLIAIPEGIEVMRSGTWATVRYARKKKIKCLVIYPNGYVE